MKEKFTLVFLCTLLYVIPSWGQTELPLYPGPIPNFKAVADQEDITADGQVIRKVSRPTLTVFLPPKEKASGTAVVICPGGGYHALMAKREGSDLAKVFNDLGVAAFVLKYRLPNDEFQEQKYIAPLQDAQQAIKTVREGSGKWGIDPDKIGIMGFSAGGHLAATAGTQFDSPAIENANKTSLRPDFMILIYPVISFTDSIGHVGSRNFLLGEAPSRDQIIRFSHEYQVKGNTPPAFITHGADDTVVPVANSVEFYRSLLRNQIPTELHIYAKGEHGYLQNPVFEEWFGRVRHWMKSMELVE
jgi:acetyl esterase/lipase